jgi:hypothetical protein
VSPRILLVLDDIVGGYHVVFAIQDTHVSVTRYERIVPRDVIVSLFLKKIEEYSSAAPEIEKSMLATKSLLLQQAQSIPMTDPCKEVKTVLLKRIMLVIRRDVHPLQRVERTAMNTSPHGKAVVAKLAYMTANGSFVGGDTERAWSAAEIADGASVHEYYARHWYRLVLACHTRSPKV